MATARRKPWLTTMLLLTALLPDPAAARGLDASTFSRPQLAHSLQRLAPTANRRVLELAAGALSCAARDARRFAVIDYSLPSTKPRLWVFDLINDKLLFKELVSHGRGSGDTRAQRFSNVPESHQSSLGLFRTLGPYQGRNGYSLRLQGLESGINDRAYERAIVIHGADYVSEAFIARTGRLGRSHGCPAVRRGVIRPLIDSIRDHQYLFIYYPDPQWLRRSALLNCAGAAAPVARN